MNRQENGPRGGNQRGPNEDRTADIDGERLALRPREAAAALGIGERLLWSMTNQGLIPHVRIGRAVLYPVAELRSWLAERAVKPNAVAPP